MNNTDSTVRFSRSCASLPKTLGVGMASADIRLCSGIKERKAREGRLTPDRGLSRLDLVVTFGALLRLRRSLFRCFIPRGCLRYHVHHDEVGHDSGRRIAERARIAGPLHVRHEIPVWR